MQSDSYSTFAGQFIFRNSTSGMVPDWLTC